METYRLQPHPGHPPRAVSGVEARIIGRDDNWLRLRWRIEGSGELVVPKFAGKGRADGLWETTCFELFLRPDGGTAYCEFNLSPSERWNAYDFAARREGMAGGAAARARRALRLVVPSPPPRRRWRGLATTTAPRPLHAASFKRCVVPTLRAGVCLSGLNCP